MSEPTLVEAGRGDSRTRRRPHPGKGRDGTRILSPPFSDVLCAVNGSRDSTEAVRQAIALGGPSAELGFVAISHQAGVGLSAQADLGEQRARLALEEAAWHARQAGIDASTELRHGARASEQLLTQSADHDLLAIGSHGGSRLGGMMLGSTATQIAHQTQVPLLIARRGAGEDDFPREILLASDGSPGSWAAARTATRLALARGSELRILFVPDGHPERYRELFKQVTAIERLTGVAPAFADLPGDPAARIVETARSRRSSLIVVGKRGLRGIKALGSVSERVVHRAPCSVLVVPPAPALAALD
jgi:nucleotide-binding universal stress UspA family protein